MEACRGTHACKMGDIGYSAAHILLNTGDSAGLYYYGGSKMQIAISAPFFVANR